MAVKKHTKAVRVIFKAGKSARKKGLRLSQSWRDRLHSCSSDDSGHLTPKQEAILAKMRKASEHATKLKKKYYAKRKPPKK
jgi:hypothetical protein